jgi:hypothetical protein
MITKVMSLVRTSEMAVLEVTVRLSLPLSRPLAYGRMKTIALGDGTSRRDLISLLKMASTSDGSLEVRSTCRR